MLRESGAFVEGSRPACYNVECHFDGDDDEDDESNDDDNDDADDDDDDDNGDDDVISYHYASHLEDGSEVEAIPYHHLVPGLLNIAMKLSCHASFCCHALAM